MRRIFDVVASMLLLMLFSPLITIIGISIWLCDPGSILFSQLREGKDGMPFRMYKFRTMDVRANELLAEYLTLHLERKAEWDAYLRLANDPRVLPRIGKPLRRSSLDELPQLWNILRGEMSFIGPRPMEPQLLNSFDSELRMVRNKVLPGLTGLWQVSGRSELRIEDMLLLDATYVEKQSASLDLWILLKTPGAVWRAEGAH